jgi:CheY-like chemotaxis protein
MQGYFDLWGCDMETANHGLEAIEMASKTGYDIILLDLRMPEMDGFKAAAEIRKSDCLNSRTPIIAVTGDISGKIKKAILNSGFSGFIVKPIDPGKLYELIIRSILGSREEGQAGKPSQSGESDMKIGQGEAVIFDQLDHLYGNAPEQYQKFLEMLIAEYNGYRLEISSAIRSGDPERFRQIRHAMLSNIRLLEMNTLKSILDEIRNLAEERNEFLPAHPQVTGLEEEMRRVIDALSAKLKVLISQ